MPITTTGRATDFITFTRTSNATVTDSNGFIEWAGHNLLLNSESFDNSYWVKLNATVTANSTASPSGATNADTLASSSSVSNTTGVYVNTTGLASGHTMSVFVKAGTSNIAWISGDNGQSYGVFSLSGSGSVLTSANGTASISAVGNSWFLITVANTTVSNAFFIIGGKDTYSSGHPWSNGTWTSGNTIFIWGAHLYRSDLGGMVLNPARGDAYYPTTPPNALGFTEDFSNAVWDKSFFGTTATSNNLIAPNGLQTADLITAINSTNDHVVYQSSGINLAASGVVTGSIYVKANTATFVRCGVVDNASGTDWAGFIVNLSTGAVTNTYTGANASNVTTHTPVSVGNGWYRIGITATLTASANNLSLRVGPFNAASASPGNYFSVSWAAAGTESIYLWGAQLSDSASLDAYSPVYGAAVTSAAYYAPRLDYDPVTLAARGLLVEEQRTNLALYSADFRNTSEAGSTRPWVQAFGALTVTANYAAAPDGTNSASRFVFTASDYAGRQQSVSLAGTTTYTFSIWVKRVSGSGAGRIEIQGASVISAAASFTATTDWTRVSVTGNTTGAGSASIYFYPEYDTNRTGEYLFWGAQLEIGASNAPAPFMTSYIPTGAATATRTADDASVSTQAFPLGSTEGTIVTSATPIGFNAANFITTLQDASLNNFVQHYYQSATNLRVNVVASGGTVAEFDNAVVMGATHKVATAFKANDFASSFNGGSPQTDNTGTAPTGFTTLNIGRRSDGFTLNGHIRQITYIPRRLTNAELVARST